ncbi:MAG: PQQ-binding-like beta-propeller repeat protein [Bacteroidales bacterium]|jgi:outer membrane protein assembly factor BamB|nr:PQQ-binding-like beta-propeller repeat protein [Bacteroidales bacterium]MCI2121589.1 PQQ-binding-like beta-propeller repeat protein [Bacteroidales bacterium]MCI2145693.1 PQQ-binding-like beta-propeller repeat protein [Bacteroidales bacterium]
MNRILVAILAVSLIAGNCTAQSSNSKGKTLRFAYLADTHIALGSDRIGFLRQCIRDVDSQPDLEFAIFNGDITEFGADEEIRLAKTIIDSLNIPYWISAGNHDAKWSESGCNTFRKVFGYENYTFVASDGIRFIGTNSGPNMRMAPALLPHETVVWLDSLTDAIPADQPVIFVNHYPQDTSMLNYFQVLDLVARTNLQLVMGGHWHHNASLTYDGGIRGMIGRSPDPDSKREVGYNIVTVTDDSIFVCEKYVGKPEMAAWLSVPRSSSPRYLGIVRKDKPKKVDGNDPKALSEFYALPDDFPWMNFSVNAESGVRTLWRVQDVSDVGCGAVTDESGTYALYADEGGTVTCLRLKDGLKVWNRTLGGKIFSTPAVSCGKVVVGCCDGGIYCFGLSDGKQLWKVECGKSVLGSPMVYGENVYIGASDGIFRALRLKDGKAVWTFEGVKGFVECKPYVDKSQVVFGTWGNTLYSLSSSRGTLQWKWETKGSRMYSPAAVWPVKSDGEIFVVTPERKFYAIDAVSGSTVFQGKGGREAIGLSENGKVFYVKTMWNKLMAVETKAVEHRPRYLWTNSDAGFGYEIAPSPITCTDSLVFVPTDKGNIFCYDASDGTLRWKYKISVALINSILPLSDNRLLVSTMDGVIALLKYR